MPPETQKDIFLGRDRQLKDLREMMSGFLTPDNALPHVALIWGQGGIGKSALLREFLLLAEGGYAGRFRTLRIDREEQRTHNHGVLNVRPEDLDTEQVLRIFVDVAGERLGLTATFKKGAFVKTRARIEQAWKMFEEARKRSEAPFAAPQSGALLEPAGELAEDLVLTTITG